MQKATLLFIPVFLWIFHDFATAKDHEGDSTAINQKRLWGLTAGLGVAYGAALIGLNEAWYKEQGKRDFHFFNDWSQWNQVDKIGHAYSAYQLSRIGKQLFLWTRMPEKKAVLWGAVMSQAMMIPIEILDGFSVEYGFSWGDITFNLLGTGLFVSQELLWQRQLVRMKFSFHTTRWAPLRPEVLGKTVMEQLLKDYNGQTYWLSFDIHGMARKGNKFPKWLNLAAGYGAEGMVYGREDENRENGYESYRQYLLSIDFDLSYIHTRHKFVNTLLFLADMIKIPAPAVEFNRKNKVNFHWIYF